MVIAGLDSGSFFLLVPLLALPIAALAFALGAGRALRQIGKGPLAIDEDLPDRSASAPAPISASQRESEIRQMLEARSYRAQARGESPLDVDAELAAILDADRAAAAAIGGDAALRDEVRQLVVARNERRMRKGQEPLDVDDEVDRQLRDLEDLGQ